MIILCAALKKYRDSWPCLRSLNAESMDLAGSIDFHLKSKKKTFSLLIYSYLRNHCPKKHYWVFDREILMIHSPPVSLGKAEVMGGLPWDAVKSN